MPTINVMLSLLYTKKLVVFFSLAFSVIAFLFLISNPISAQYCVCGDAVCAPACGETSGTCPVDCGAPTPPPAVCGDLVCGGSETANSCPADCGYTLSGTVYDDVVGNSCASGATAYAGGGLVTIYNGAVSVGSGASNGSGAYSAKDTQVPGTRTAVLSNISDYTVRAARYQGGAWGTGSLSGYVYGPFSLTSNQSLDWCISNIKPWYQVDTGDVRRVSISNKVPAGKYGSTDINFPGIFFSSNWPTDFGSGQPSTKLWKVEDEYSYVKNSANRNGTVAYSYYKNRATSTGQTVLAVPGCTNGEGSNCTVSLTNLTTGVYEFDAGGTGTLTLTGYAQRAGAHITLLINGNTNITTNITIPTGVGNLFILAAKGNITVDKSVGESSPSSTTIDLEGIYSAEGKITLDGDTCPAGIPDKRLNIGGVLIANAQKPFTTGGVGVIDNKRSLCLANDSTYPSLYIKTRFDFLFQLSDFYLVRTSKFSEIQP